MLMQKKCGSMFNVLIKLGILLFIVFASVKMGFTNEGIENLLKEEIFSYTTLILFCATILSALVAMLAFLFMSFDKINAKLHDDKVGTRGIQEKQNKITKEIKENIYCIFGSMFFAFIYMLFMNSKLIDSSSLSLIQFLSSDNGKFTILVYIYVLVFFAIGDIVLAIMRLLQEGYRTHNNE